MSQKLEVHGCACACGHGGHGGGISRRWFLGGAATMAAAAATLGPGCLDTAGSGYVYTPRTRVDIHHHLFPQVWHDYVERQGGFGAIGLAPNLHEPVIPDGHFEFMSTWHISAAVVSLVPPACAYGAVDDRRTTARAVNEVGAGLIRDHGSRFGFLATSSLPDVDGALLELQYAFDTLQVDGFAVQTNYFGDYIGSPTFEPVYAELNARNAVVLVHPTNPAYAPPNVGFSFPLPHFCFEWIADSARAMTNLIYRGVAKRYPNIRWIFMHAGGAMTAHAFRQVGLHAFLPGFNDALPEGPMPYLEQFYWDTAQAYTPAPMRSVREIAPVSHILGGTDWPPIKNFYDNAKTVVPYPVEQLPDPAVGDPAPALSLAFSKREREMIDADNSLALFPRLKQRMGL